jgi:hypothetical protein
MEFWLGEVSTMTGSRTWSSGWERWVFGDNLDKIFQLKEEIVYIRYLMILVNFFSYLYSVG